LALGRIVDMTRLSNAPIGWAAFRALRKPTTSLSRRRHGNWIHGRYSRGGIEGMRELRQIVRILRGAWWLSIPGADRPKPLGWRVLSDPVKRGATREKPQPSNRGRIDRRDSVGLRKLGDRDSASK
jgi:hypothetical protein